jgi:hypothetical protein
MPRNEAEVLGEGMDSRKGRLAVEAVARRSYGKLVAFVAARKRDAAKARRPSARQRLRLGFEAHFEF